MPSPSMNIAVVDNGGQWTHKEWRTLKYLGCNAEIVLNTTPLGDLDQFDALVLSGGSPRIETESDSLGLTSEYLNSEIWPILGICVGHQYMATHFGGKAGPASIPEFGEAQLKINDNGWLLSNLPSEFKVWESHNDEVTELPDSFKILASSKDCSIQAMEHESLPYAGVQFHPEVEHSEFGAEIFTNFLKKAFNYRNSN